MGSLPETQHVMEEALALEKKAEENCGRLSQELKANGFYEVIKRIKNDE